MTFETKVAGFDTGLEESQYGSMKEKLFEVQL